ncbi:carotenoid oxygenase family protein [Geitlerinema sp. CS-897]|nr:carotenoid oxygenase family protein [Geitlerinema sp. CS-897]
MTHSTRFPKAVLSTSRAEFYDAPLELKVCDADGNPTSIPEDLQGHVFIIGPVGSVDSPHLEGDPSVVLPSADGWTPLVNGDGMVYRLDFHRTTTASTTGKAWLATRRVEPPSFYADALTHAPNSPYHTLRFWNLGISRFSLELGLCNQINTAFVPVRFPGDPCDRLVVTNDASRPYEIDPRSLKLLAPVGENRHWHPLNRSPIPYPFRPVMGSAHPAFDPKTGEFFIANVQKSLKTILHAPRLFPWRNGDRVTGWDILHSFVTDPLLQLWQRWHAIRQGSKRASDDAVHLMRWTGKTTVESWQLVLEDGTPVKIRQSCHQLGVTRRYVVLADTAFKLALEDMLPSSILGRTRQWKSQLWHDLDGANPEEAAQTVKRRAGQWIEWLRERLTYPQSPNTDLYLVEREQLQRVPSGEAVVAQKVTVDGPFTHYLTDYDDSDGAIVLHAGMNYKTDPAEFIHRQDSSVFDDPELDETLKSLAGMMTAGLDINAPAAIAIDLDTKQVRQCELNLPEAIARTFYIGLYAFRDEFPSDRIEDLYWTGGGAWPELLTNLVYGLYAEGGDRRVATEEILKLLKSEQYAPVVLSHFRIDRDKLLEPNASPDEVVTAIDSYSFDRQYYPNSPQFVPRPNATSATDGYIICNVVSSDRLQSCDGETTDLNSSENSELWVFDAENLKNGPSYKLSHPQLNFGLTIHTTWLANLPESDWTRPDYRVSEDFDWLVSQVTEAYSNNIVLWLLTRGRSPQIARNIRALFDEIYRRFNQ